ncbi:hypothetical protein ACWECC_21150 [Streptomyces microflavus]
MVETERMTGSSSYESHPEYLPDFMNDRRDDDGRQVVKLDLAENRELASATLSTFPAATNDVIDFETVSFEERLWWDDEEHWTRMASELLSSYVQRGERVAIIWGIHVMPTVTMPADVAVRHAQDILDAGPHFWIHPLGGSALIECLMDGQVTIATVPSARAPRTAVTADTENRAVPAGIGTCSSGWRSSPSNSNRGSTASSSGGAAAVRPAPDRLSSRSDSGAPPRRRAAGYRRR